MSFTVSGSSGVTAAHDIIIEVDESSSDTESDSDGQTPFLNLLEWSQLLLDQHDTSTFVSTRAVLQVHTLISRLGVAIIEGRSGQGKTAMATNFLKTFKNPKIEGYRPLILVNPDSWQHIPHGEKLIVFIDDIFGRSNFSTTLFRKWQQCFEDIWTSVKTGDLCILITSRSHILHGCWQHVSKYPLFDEKHRISLHLEDFALRKHEKLEILNSHLNMFHVSMGESERVRVAEYTPNLGFPQCCRYFVSSKAVQANGVEFFKNPQSVLLKEISVLSEFENLKFFVLVTVMMREGKISASEMGTMETWDNRIMQSCRVPQTISEANVKEAAISLCGTFLVHDKSMNLFYFSHQSVWDAICLVFGSLHTEEIIKICPVQILATNVMTQGCHRTEEEVLVVTKSSNYGPLIERLLYEFDKGNMLIAVKHRSFSDPEFVEAFYSQLTNTDGLMNILRRKMPEFLFKYSEFDILSLSVIAGHTEFVKKLVSGGLFEKLPNRGTSVKHLALEAACDTGNEEIFRLLLSSGAIPCEDCLLIACRSDYEETNVIRLLVLSIALHTATHTLLNDCLQCLVMRKKANSLKTFVECLPDNSNFQAMLMTALSNSIVFGSYSGFTTLWEACEEQPSSNSLLWLAVIGGDPDIINALLDFGADINIRDELGQTPLHMACRAGKSKAVEMLFAKGADVHAADIFEQTALHKAAVATADRDVLKLLFQRGLSVHKVDDKGQNCTHVAASANNFKAITIFLNEGAAVNLVDTDGNTPLHVAVSCSIPNRNVVKLLIENGASVTACNYNRETVLHRVTADLRSTESCEILKFLLLEHCCKSMLSLQDNSGLTALHHAASSRFGRDAVEILCDCEANMELKDNTGETPLHKACKVKDNTNLAAFLIKRGANPSAKDLSGQTPLHKAIGIKGWQFVVNLLLDYGADVTEVDTCNKQTPLHIAAASVQCTDTVQLLLQREANADAVDALGQTPLHCACFSGHPKTVKLLVEHGANVTNIDGMGDSVLHKAAEWGPQLTGYSTYAFLCTLDVADILADNPIQILIAGGHNINTKNKRGETPLIKAAASMINYTICSNSTEEQTLEAEERQKRYELCKMDIHCKLASLLNKGAFVDSSDIDGNTALHKACSGAGQFTYLVVQELLSSAADPTIKNKAGLTPGDIACMKQMEDVVEALKCSHEIVIYSRQ